MNNDKLDAIIREKLDKLPPAALPLSLTDEEITQAAEFIIQAVSNGWIKI